MTRFGRLLILQQRAIITAIVPAAAALHLVQGLELARLLVIALLLSQGLSLQLETTHKLTDGFVRIIEKGHNLMVETTPRKNQYNPIPAIGHSKIAGGQIERTHSKLRPRY